MNEYAYFHYCYKHYHLSLDNNVHGCMADCENLAGGRLSYPSHCNLPNVKR